jgi:uncharacterized membrane protein
MQKLSADDEALFRRATEQLEKLREIAARNLREQETITHKLAHASKVKLTLGQNLADRITRFGGSWKFVISFFVILIVWIGINGYLLKEKSFDPYPFILMNLILSCVAALQAPFIMMSQNRQEEKDRERAENDYKVNLKAELEIRSLHDKLNIMQQEQLATLYEIQARQIELLQMIHEKLSTSSKE